VVGCQQSQILVKPLHREGFQRAILIQQLFLPPQPPGNALIHAWLVRHDSSFSCLVIYRRYNK
jgi:hypothetical protein